MAADPFQYTIRNKDIADELQLQGFTSVLDEDNSWIVIAPDTLSATKARKIISATINLYSAAKELGKAQNKYDKLLIELTELSSINIDTQQYKGTQ